MNKDVKLLRHRAQVQGIVDGKFLPPVMTDVDPVNGTCNLDCAWCCQSASRSATKTAFMPVSTMERLGSFCRDWGVKAWRISSDSEPLLNKQIPVLIESGRAAGIDMGLITNGTYLERVFDVAHLLDWVGVSLDAATRDTWSRLKGSPPENFDKIIQNVRELHAKHPLLDLSLKFLRWTPETSLAQNEFAIGQLPVVQPNAPDLPNNFADAELLPALAESLGVHMIVKDAYPKDFASRYPFSKCLATPLGGVFGADHRFHLCCDARSIFILTDDYTREDWEELPDLWGGDKHKQLIKQIVPRNCAGCAKSSINELLQHVVGTTGKTSGYQPNFI